MDAQETSLFTAVLITCIVLSVIITYFIITIIRNHRRNRELYKSKILAEITTLENERKRIASDLHDELGPVLLSVKYKMNSFDILSEDDQDILDKANKNIDDIINRMREISNDLLPTSLLRKGLIVAMEEAIENLNKPNGLRIKFTHEGIPQLPENKTIHIYRILMEIIHNTLKHAKATELRIELNAKNKNLNIYAEDNGCGFNYLLQSEMYSGLGLRNLLSRTEILGGNMYLDSGLGKGTRYVFDLPL